MLPLPHPAECRKADQLTRCSLTLATHRALLIEIRLHLPMQGLSFKDEAPVKSSAALPLTQFETRNRRPSLPPAARGSACEQDKGRHLAGTRSSSSEQRQFRGKGGNRGSACHIK